LSQGLRTVLGLVSERLDVFDEVIEAAALGAQVAADVPHLRLHLLGGPADFIEVADGCVAAEAEIGHGGEARRKRGIEGR
jgi:hypothetical protein